MNMPLPNSLSLVVCTRNRAAQLGPCLNAIAAMDKPPGFELVVVDNGSSDQTQAVLSSFERHADFPVRTVQEPRKGLANARNCGWCHAQGELLAFTDDDCYVAPDFAHAIIAAFDANPLLGYLGGRIKLFDSSDLPLTILDVDTPRLFEPGSVLPAGAIQGANFAFRKRALADAHGFDPLLGAGTPFPSEDIEMLARLSAAGWHGAYDPAPIVFHHHGRKTARDAAMLEVSYDVGRGAYYASRLLDKRARLQYLKHWYWAMRNQPLPRSFREFRGAVGYVLHRITSHAHL